MTWRRTMLWMAGFAGLLGLAAMFALTWIVDPQVLRTAARDKARAAWQRELHIGDVSLRLWPVPSIRAVKVAFANPDWAQERNLIEAENVDADLELVPLLTGKVRVKSLTLSSVRAFLEVGEDGAVSWELRDARSGEAEAVPASTGTELLQIAEVRLFDVEVHHRAAGRAAAPLYIQESLVTTQAGLRDIHAEARVVRHDQPLHLKARLADVSGYGKEGAATDGRLELAWAKTRAHLEGRFPLSRSLKGEALKGEMKSESLEDLFGFFGVKRERMAPASLRFESREEDGRVRIEDLALTLGAVEVRGSGTVALDGRRPVIDARLRADRIDWRRTLVDVGGTLRPPRNDGEIFHEDRVAWRAVAAIGKVDGRAELEIGALKLGNGVQLEQFKSRATFGDDKLELAAISTRLLGGQATGRLAFDADKKTIRAQVDGSNLLLERWFAERGRKIPFTGGPMKVNATLAFSGATYQALAASVTGRATLRMGKAAWKSERAGELEELMVRALAPKESGHIDFECAAAVLEFRNGKAHGRRILGARSDVSQLVTSGYIDFREETLDLRGRVRPTSGPGLGLANVAGDLQITGRLAKPRVQLDPDQKPAMIARAGAAIATAGVTLLGSALADAADKTDACQI